MREHGQDEQALEKFSKAYDLSPTPRARAQMALAEQALGRWSLAEGHLSEAMAQAEDAWIAKNHAPLESALATVRSHLGELGIDGGEAGAEVLVDNAKVATLPLEHALRLEVGSHVLVVKKEGYFPVERTVRIAPDAPAREHVDLVAVAVSQPPVPAPTPLTLPEPPKPESVSSRFAPGRGDPGRVQRIFGEGLLVGSVPLLALGVAGMVARLDAIARYNGDATCPGVDRPSQPPSCQGLINDASTWQTVGVVGLAGAGAFAISGAFVFFTAPKKNDGGKLSCAPMMAGGLCFGEF